MKDPDSPLLLNYYKKHETPQTMDNSFMKIAGASPFVSKIK
jgi:hypothetical protein